MFAGNHAPWRDGQTVSFILPTRAPASPGDRARPRVHGGGGRPRDARRGRGHAAKPCAPHRHPRARQPSLRGARTPLGFLDAPADTAPLASWLRGALDRLDGRLDLATASPARRGRLVPAHDWFRGWEWRRRLALQAAPVYSHLHHGNSNSIGIEIAHSGRADDPFPPAQTRALDWLLRTLLEMSHGRLATADVYGHKDLDRRPAYVEASCVEPGCPVYTDAEGRTYRRRVDPPEAIFGALAGEGLVISRRAREDDRELRRAEALGALPAPVQRLP